MNNDLRRAVSLILFALLVACNGDAPLLTCKDPCAKSDEYRDLFCACQKKPKPGTGGGTTAPPPGSPALDFEWKEHDGCSLNRRVWMLNYHPRTLVVTLSWKVPNKSDRDEKSYTIGGNRVTRASGIELGYEEVNLHNGSFCFDKDFMIKTWREPQHATAHESALAYLAESAPEMKARQLAMIRGMEEVQLASEGGTAGLLAAAPAITYHKDAIIQQKAEVVTPVDCTQVCDGGDTLRCPIRGFPPDQEKLAKVRDRLREPVTKAVYEPADIYSIFGLDKKACARGDIRVAGQNLVNSGQYCSFPTYLHDTDKEPSLAIHFPNVVKGTRAETNPQKAGIVFGSGFGMPILIFAREDLNSNYGGVVQDAIATNKGVYYQTTGTCIFIGLKQP